MYQSFLNLIYCPECQSNLSIIEAHEEHGQIWSGQLTCEKGHTYQIRNGMPHLFVNNDAWKPKSTEADGWVTYHQDLGIYDPVTDEDAVDLHIPYYPGEPWSSVAHSFDIGLAELQLTGNETVLDLGAARGWAAKQFALKGCNTVAIDITDDMNVGLGRAHALMKHANTHFDLVLGDGENLPFPDNTFDLIFCSATVHHFSDLPLMFRNIAAKLKPNGRFCAVYEPCIPIWQKESVVLKKSAQKELELGINETRPNVNQYIDTLIEGGLTPTTIIPSHTHPLTAVQTIAWAESLGAIWNGKAPLRTKLFYLTLRLKTMLMGHTHFARQTYPFFDDPKANAAYQILKWAGGDLLLIATKSE